MKDFKEHIQHNLEKRAKFLGYPLNLAFSFEDIYDIFSVSLNLLGSPYESGTRYKYEKNVVDHIAHLYNFNKGAYWGYVTSGGTEGNMYGLLLGRVKMEDSVLLFSEASHYSIEKNAQILKIPFEKVKSLNSGEIDYADLEKILNKYPGKGILLNCNLGTTMRGGIDNLEKIKQLLDKTNPDNYYIHVDGALFGGYMPYVDVHITKILGKVADSFAISGHKFFGTPFPSGIFLCKKNLPSKFTTAKYTKSSDVTFLGSRNGHSAALLWYLIQKKHPNVFKQEIEECLDKAKYLQNSLENLGYPVWRNESSNIVFFKKVAPLVAKNWILANEDNISHVVVMQHVTKAMLDGFLLDLAKTL